jgi:NAD(P)H-hydrate repair Nnr-like enzyme with NAD(P)H-hydrate dehydratase domain
MHGFLEMLALLAFTTTGTGLLLAGVIAAILAADRHAAARHAKDRRAGDPRSTSAAGRAVERAAGPSTEGRAERRSERTVLRG